jgi:hypothetical protein
MNPPTTGSEPKIVFIMRITTSLLLPLGQYLQLCHQGFDFVNCKNILSQEYY